MKNRFALILLASVILLTHAALAEARSEDPTTEQARKHFQAGQDFFDVGRWDEAAAEFEQAYALRKDPTFIYNMAQAYRRKGDAKRALDLYKNYLIKKPDSPQRADVEERIKTLQQQLDAEAERMNKANTPPGATQAPRPAADATPAVAPFQPPPVAIQPPPVAAQPPVYQPPLPQTTAIQIPAQAPVSTANPGLGLRIAGVTLGAVAVASAGAGALFGWRTKSLSDKVSSAPTFKSGDEDAATQAQTLQWVCYGVSAGAAVAGGVLYWIGFSAAKHGAAPAIALSPTLVPSGAGLSAQGAF
jgi:tetratricopeptide (TPR) repeat protein